MRGGVILDHHNQSSLRFSLEESIWFVEGQEVAELYSLSIDPDVTITEENQYVVIEGNLQVSGEYRGVESQLISADDHTDEEQAQYVDKVEQRQDDGIFMFYHHFPVNISIPTNRVMNREVVEIDVSSFDYHMPETRCIKLFAELLITGIYEEETIEEREWDVAYNDADIEQFISHQEKNEVEPMSVSLQPQEYESFTAEAFAFPRDETEKYQENEEVTEQHIPFNPMQPNFSFPIPTFQRTEEDTTFGNVPPFDKEEHSNQEELVPSYVESINNEEWVQGVVETRTSDKVLQPDLQQQSVRDEDDEREQSDNLSERVEIEVQDESVLEKALQEEREESAPTVTYYNQLNRKVHKPVEEPVDEKGREPARASVHLTDFFAKKETQARTSLKVCIVQNGESLSNLASRYSVNKSDIMSYNDLNSDNDVYEGQVLYIPKSANK